MTGGRRVYRPLTANIAVAEPLCLSVVAAVQSVQRKESGFEVAGLDAEAILSRTVVAAAEENSLSELGAASDFVRMMEQTGVVVGVIRALELVAEIESVYAVDFRLVSETVPVELGDEHLVIACSVGAGTRYSEIL